MLLLIVFLKTHKAECAFKLDIADVSLQNVTHFSFRLYFVCYGFIVVSLCLCCPLVPELLFTISVLLVKSFLLAFSFL